MSDEFPPDFNPWVTPGEFYTGIPAPGNAVFPWIQLQPLTFVPDLPTIAVSFSQELDPGCLTDTAALTVWRSPLLSYSGRFPVAGTWAFADSTVLLPADMPAGANSAAVFTPAEIILPNSIYTVYVGRAVKTLSGTYLPESAHYHFFSKLFPVYCNPYDVRRLLGEYSNSVSQEQMLYEIWRASVACNRETMFVVPPYTLIGGPSSQDVISWNYNRTYAMDQFTLYESVINILHTLSLKYMDDSNRQEQGMDFMTAIKDKIADLAATVKKFRDLREPFFLEISRKRARIRSTQKSSRWPDGFTGAWDMSFRPRRGF